MTKFEWRMNERGVCIRHSEFEFRHSPGAGLWQFGREERIVAAGVCPQRGITRGAKRRKSVSLINPQLFVNTEFAENGAMMNEPFGESENRYQMRSLGVGGGRGE